MDFESEEYKRYKKYRDENYPYFDPCRKCNYWRGASGSHSNNLSLPTCDYFMITGRTRDCIPDLENGTCEKFDPKIKGGRQKKKF